MWLRDIMSCGTVIVINYYVIGLWFKISIGNIFQTISFFYANPLIVFLHAIYSYSFFLGFTKPEALLIPSQRPFHCPHSQAAAF